MQYLRNLSLRQVRLLNLESRVVLVPRLLRHPSRIWALTKSSLTCQQRLVKLSARAMTPAEQPPTQETRLINLLRGWPSPHVLPAEALKAAANKVLSNPDIFVPGLQYGPDPGYQPLREELAKFLSDYFETEPDAERICITGGASQSLACILQSYTEPVYTKAIWVIAPCYYLACPIFEDSGFKGRLRAIPEDDQGINLEMLEKGLQSLEDTIDPTEKPVYKNPDFRKVYRHVIYVVPSSANPSGKTMSLRRREGLVRLARQYDCLVVCDDVYDFLQWPVSHNSSLSPSITASTSASASAVAPLPRVRPLARLSDIDFSLGPSPFDPEGNWFGHAISNGSFSKIIAPGMRTGWVEGTRDFAFGLAQTGSTKSGGAPSQFSATMVWEMLRNGDLARQIDGTCRPALQRRHALLMKEVRRQLDRFGIKVLDGNLGTEGQVTYGGYFVWITFPKGPAAQDIARLAMEQENLIVPPGSMFEVKGDEAASKFDNSIRLCFSWEDEQSLVEGVTRLARVVDGLQSDGPGMSQQKGSAAKKMDAFF